MNSQEENKAIPSGDASLQRWKYFEEKLDGLTKKEARANGEDYLCVYGSYDERIELPAGWQAGAGAFCPLEVPETGFWIYDGSGEVDFRKQFQDCAVLCGKALGCPNGIEADQFWFHRLFAFLRERHPDSISSATGGRIHTIGHICSASAKFCFWLAGSAPLETLANSTPELKESGLTGKGLGQKNVDLSRYFDAANLTERQRECASMKYEHGLGVTEIGRRLHIHHSSVRDAIDAADRKLKRDQDFKRALQKSVARRNSPEMS